VTERPTSTLADRLALAIIEHGPLPGDRLALNVGARKADVLYELKSNPMFEHSGGGRWSRWRLAPSPSPWEQQGTVLSARSMSDHGTARP
jgi:hypothetical protein